MYGNIGHAVDAKCARDLEGDAKRLKGRIDGNTKLVEAIESFAGGDDLYQIDNQEDRKTFFAIYGDLKMRLPGMEKEYDRLLELMEKEAR